MTKKILSTVAAAAVLATGAMAYDVAQYKGDKLNMTYETNASTSIEMDGSKFGDALIFPAYFVGNGWETTLRVINTSEKEAVVAKVVLFAGNDSREVRDFNIYLSANDEWIGTIKIDDDGVARVISTDGSSPLTSGEMATADSPMKSDAVDVASGYVEVIGCAATEDNSGAHGLHKSLREAYATLAESSRSITKPVIFSNGMITSGAKFPYIAHGIKGGVATSTTFTFKSVPNVLIGDVRITDTVNGKDMVMSAVALQNVTEDDRNATLLYVEGEAANIADRDIGNGTDSNNTYNDMLDKDANVFEVNNVYMTYGDTSSLTNNQLIITCENIIIKSIRIAKNAKIREFL